MGDIFAILLTVLLIAANGFFVAAEFAVLAARRARLEQLAADGDGRALAGSKASKELSVMLARVLRGHFTADHHFAFEASAWYWHFVDVVWLLLFVLVYWL